MQFINGNIELLSKNKYHWIGEDKSNFIDEFIEVDENGREILYVNCNQVILIDEFDITQKPNNLKRELIFLIGINSINEINKVYQNMSKESFLIIIEPNNLFLNHALHHKELDLFKNNNVILFADDLMNFSFFLDNLFSTILINYIKNIRFYFTYFYKNYGTGINREIINKLKETVKYKTLIFGNSIEDSLTGLKHNLRNIKQLTRSKNVSLLKDSFKGKPAVVVSAGPSLNKNIEQLKKAKNYAVIIAVDTIVDNLLKNGIIPDFICSVEREKETYTYFYENKKYPADITLVAPLLLYPSIFEEYEGEIMIPMRENVGEYKWFQDILGLSGDNNVSMGISCAHVAFGVAEHVGASPIVLIGQDLSFGSTRETSHAIGTIYDDKDFTNKAFSNVEDIAIEGYYGGTVISTNTWISFRKWFEKEILEKNLFVINATEGGAKIANTVQKNLADVIEEYCKKQFKVKEVIDSIDTYPIDDSKMEASLHSQKKFFIKMKYQLEKQLKKVNTLKISNQLSTNEQLIILNNLQRTDQLFHKINQNWLLRHNLQPAMMTAIWNLYEMEQVLSIPNLKRNKEIQIEFLTVAVFVIKEIIELIEQCLESNFKVF